MRAPNTHMPMKFRWSDYKPDFVCVVALAFIVLVVQASWLKVCRRPFQMSLCSATAAPDIIWLRITVDSEPPPPRQQHVLEDVACETCAAAVPLSITLGASMFMI